jgi:hypothetical protein
LSGIGIVFSSLSVSFLINLSCMLFTIL